MPDVPLLVPAASAVPAVPRLVQDAMHPNVMMIHAGASLPEAVVRMQTLGVRRLLVVGEGKLVGLLTDGALNRALPALREHATPWDAAYQAGRRRVGEAMRREVFTARPGDLLHTAIQTLQDRQVGGLPVVGQGGSLLGILTLTDVLRSVAAHPEPSWGTVAEWMSEELVTAGPDMPLAEAVARLSITRLRVLPVVEHGALLGVLHVQDLQALTAAQGAASGPTLEASHHFLRGQVVRDLMQPPSAEVLGTAPLLSAVQAMLAADVHGLPVVGEQRMLLGVITVSDLLRAILKG
jgi:CBS domain-containing protein